MISGLESVTFYDPPGNESLETLDHSVSLENLQGNCAYTDEGLELSLSVDIIARFGPMFDQDTVEVPFFVVVATPDEQIVFKRVFETSIDPDLGDRSAGNREFFEQRIFAVTPANGPEHSILFGLEIDPEQALDNIERS